MNLYEATKLSRLGLAGFYIGKKVLFVYNKQDDTLTRFTLSGSKNKWKKKQFPLYSQEEHHAWEPIAPHQN